MYIGNLAYWYKHQKMALIFCLEEAKTIVTRHVSPKSKPMDILCIHLIIRLFFGPNPPALRNKLSTNVGLLKMPNWIA